MQNIVNCVDSSHIFVAILTPNYVNSTWCMFELFLAQARKMKQISNLIVIVKEGIDKKSTSRLDKRIQMTLKLWTYLEWPQNHNIESVSDAFWNKLANCIQMSINKSLSDV